MPHVQVKAAVKLEQLAARFEPMTIRCGDTVVKTLAF